MLWLSAWCFGLVAVTRQVKERPDWRGAAVIAAMGGIAVVIGAYVLWAFIGRDELRVEQGTVRYSRRVWIAIRRKRMRVGAVRNVDVGMRGRGRGGMQPAIEIVGEGRTIRFGMGRLSAELV